ncbi:MAG: phosphotransferase [Rhizobiaceae bacterium]
MRGQSEHGISTEKFAAISSLPIWSGALKLSPLTGGISNESWVVTDSIKSRVVRFGDDYPFHHVDRAHESMVARAAHAAGFSPEVITTVPGMMVTQFLEARTYDADSVRKSIQELSALVKAFHQTMPQHVSGYARLFWVFHVIRDYARTLQIAGMSETAELSRFCQISKALESVQVPLPLIYGHNDLLPANFLAADGRIWLIDFEYAGFSTAMFDLAGLSSNSGFSRDQSLELLEIYFGESPDPGLIRSLEAMQCASLLREAMWSMVSECYLKAPGVDYEAYTAAQLEAFSQRLENYQIRYGKIPLS